MKRGHDICGFTEVALEPHISIVDSATYEPNDEEMLICPNLLPDDFENFKSCNFEAGLQRAVFIKNDRSQDSLKTIKVLQIFQTILKRFNGQASAIDFGENGFDFFGAFHGQDNSIFKVGCEEK